METCGGFNFMDLVLCSDLVNSVLCRCQPKRPLSMKQIPFQTTFIKRSLQIIENNPFGKFSAAILFKDVALKLKLNLNSI